MNRLKLVGICVLASTLALSGCMASNHNLKRDRVDQNLSSSAGNRGYIMGQVVQPKESKTSSQKPVVVNQAEMDSVIAVFSEAIMKNPNYTGAYYNRAIAYFYKKDYQRCWQDVHKAESLGGTFSVDFINSLKKASRREK